MVDLNPTNFIVAGRTQELSATLFDVMSLPSFPGSPTKNSIIDTGDTETKISYQSIGDQTTYEWSFGREAKRRATTVTNITTELHSGSSAKVTKQIIDGSNGYATIEVTSAGRSTLTIVCEFADGSRREMRVIIEAVGAPYWGGDY